MVKTLKGGKFHVECDGSNTVSEVKGLIEREKTELPASGMKLIHSGKVLKDDQKIEACGIKPNDFLVVMVTKAKKSAVPATTATPATPAPVAAAATTASAVATPAPTPAAAASSTSSSSNTAASTSSTEAPAAPSRDDFPAEILTNLTGMGFPEAEVRHCLRAANGNPDIAMEFLTNGIPPGVQQPTAGQGGVSSPSATSTSGRPLAALRSHPQFNELRRLVQSNPQLLQTVLTQIGQQQPELLQEINANQAAFLEMMNEPIEAAAPAVPPTNSAPSGSSSSSSSTNPSSSLGGGGGGGMPGMLEGTADPAQMAQMIQSMSPTELNQMAAMMGLSPEQLRTTAQMLGQIPPEQLQQYMMQAMAGGGEGMAGLFGGAGAQGGAGGGAGFGGPQLLRLTEEEMAAVDRLTEMGFDRSEAAQAFLACDKNEALAANLLMDSMGDGGGAFFGGGDDSAPSGGNNSGNGGDDDEDMYG